MTTDDDPRQRLANVLSTDIETMQDALADIESDAEALLKDGDHGAFAEHLRKANHHLLTAWQMLGNQGRWRSKLAEKEDATDG